MDYQLLTQEDLDKFNLMVPITVTAPIPRSSAYPPPTSNPAMTNFNIGVKRDPNHFQIFSNERNWSDYKGNTIITANIQYIEEVLNPNFVHIDGAATDLFTAKQKNIPNMCY